MKRPLRKTYDFLMRKLALFEKKGRPISKNKSVCLIYLRWGCFAERDDKLALIQAVKEWRKGRVGGKRTLLERKVRGFMNSTKKEMNMERGREVSREGARAFARKQVETQTGAHNPELAQARSERARRNLEILRADGRSGAPKVWVVTDPNGVEFITVSLNRFCRYMGFNERELNRTAHNGYKKRHKGYRCKLYNPEFDKGLPILVFYPGEDRPPEQVGSLEDIPAARGKFT